MGGTVGCPYCEHENNMTNGLEDLNSDNMFDWECDKCGEEFEVQVEFEPSFGAGKIEYVKCEICNVETRNPARRRTTFPYPECIKEDVICRSCFHNGNIGDFENRKKSGSNL